MRLLSNLHVKGKPAVLPDRAVRRQSRYFIYRPRINTCGAVLSGGCVDLYEVRMENLRFPATITFELL